jgi:type I restriction enzyme R subunit
VIRHTDIAPTGPDQLFDNEEMTRLSAKIEAINASAVA